MYNDFYDFYSSVGVGGGKALKWKKLEEVLKIKEKTYPSNKAILDYYTETFRCNTSALMRSKWHSMDKLLYVWVVTKYCDLKKKNLLSLDKADFKEFSSILQVSENLLEFKWLKLAKPFIKSIPWQEKEDAMLKALMEGDSNKKWTEIAIKLFEANVSKILRTAKQVRERWVNYIDPSLKRQEWTKQQDQQLFEVVQKLGKKWSTVGKIFQRTQNNVKNRYNSLINKTSRTDSFSMVEEKDEIDKDNAKTSVALRAEIREIKSIEKMCGYREISSLDLQSS